MSEQTITTTVLRYYVENGAPKVEAVLWRWVPGDPNGGDVAKAIAVDPGLFARARRLPREYDPGMNPNRWVWVGANDAAAKLPRPGETIRGETKKPDGSIQETVDHVHAVDSPYWDYYRLPLRPGVELIDEDAWAALKAEADKAAAERTEAHKALIAQQQADRATAQASARTKLAALGLSDEEIAALVR